MIKVTLVLEISSVPLLAVYLVSTSFYKKNGLWLYTKEKRDFIRRKNIETERYVFFGISEAWQIHVGELVLQYVVLVA